MARVYYTKEHEWIAVDGDTATVGITAHAAEQLGDIVYVETPAEGASVEKGAEAGVVESVKAASDVYAPASGEVTETNTALEGEPGKVNESPQGEGWFYRLKLSDPSELEDLMDEAAYKDFLKSEG